MNVFVPRSKSGWWAAGFAAGAILAIFIGQLVAGISMIGHESPTATGLLLAIAIACGICILGGLVASVLALRHHDRSAPVWVAVAFAVLSAFLLVGEFALPH